MVIFIGRSKQGFPFNFVKLNLAKLKVRIKHHLDQSKHRTFNFWYSLSLSLAISCNSRTFLRSSSKSRSSSVIDGKVSNRSDGASHQPSCCLKDSSLHSLSCSVEISHQCRSRPYH